MENTQLIYLIARLLQRNLKRGGVQHVQGQFMLDVQLWSETEQNSSTDEEGNSEQYNGFRNAFVWIDGSFLWNIT